MEINIPNKKKDIRQFSIKTDKKTKVLLEEIMKVIFFLCALCAVFAVVSITLYLVLNGMPPLFKIGFKKILFETKWAPTAVEPKYGILYIILTSIIGTIFAVIIGVPVGVLTAIFIAEVAPKKIVSIVKPAVELLAGIPSVIYGLLGIMILNPVMYKLELIIFKNSQSHQFTGGSNLLSAIIVLAIMILPTVINISESAIRMVPLEMKSASLALGASKMQTIFKIVLPIAKSGIMSSIVLGVGRAIGEAMAITLVSGSSVNIPLPFNSVRFLTTAIVAEMGYAADEHRQVLFTIGMILFLFIMFVNIVFTKLMKGVEKK